MLCYSTLKTDLLGEIALVQENDKIVRLEFSKDIPGIKGELLLTPLLETAFLQLENYLNGRLKDFGLPLEFKGTPFQISVWKGLMKVDYGQTISYKELAAMVGNPKACRAVGMANNRNPLPIIVPCHRCLGHDGRLVGYGGGLDIKEKLLKLEGVQLKK